MRDQPHLQLTNFKNLARPPTYAQDGVVKSRDLRDSRFVYCEGRSPVGLTERVFLTEKWVKGSYQRLSISE